MSENLRRVSYIGKNDKGQSETREGYFHFWEQWSNDGAACSFALIEDAEFGKVVKILPQFVKFVD